MMKKILTYAVSALALASCSSDSLVSDSPANTQAPIAFNAGQKNITRGVTRAPFENSFSDFRVWAYKYKTGATPSSAKVMDNYKVTYKKDGENKTVWYYDGLESQVLHYWDYSTDNTNFYAYAPYNKDVTFDANNKTIEVPASVNVAGYSKTSDFVYAGNSVARNDYNEPVELHFKRLGAIVNLKFYTDITGYKVQLIDANPASTGSAIQATPTADKKEKSEYYKGYKALINYSTPSMPTVEVSGTATSTEDNLIFDLPTGDLPTDQANAVSSGTTYYAVAQPTTSTTGFTFHVSYKLTATDNSEVITVRDARVFIPAKGVNKNTGETTYIAAWQPNTQYTYTFKITTNTNGKTAEDTINLDNPEVPGEAGLYPIIFDNITIEEITNVAY